MSNLKKIAKEIGITLLDGFRKASYRQIDAAVFEEETRGIKKAIMAMKEAGIDDEVIVSLLQKYWDLRTSEAKEIMESIDTYAAE